MRRTRIVASRAILFGLVVLAIEGISYLGCEVLIRRGVVFYAPMVDIAKFEKYMDNRDPVLGWPSPKLKAADTDKSGSRIVPVFPEPEKWPSCVSLYGDSFTWSDEVDNDHAWSNILSKLMGCRVANYGVKGYGTDQAFLRFLGNVGDRSGIVVLGHMSENVLRNVNQYRGLLYKEQEYGLKPRFVLDENDQLRLIPLPKFAKSDFLKMTENPNAYLKYEYFVLDGPTGITTASFPYSLSIVRALRNFHILEKIRGVPRYSEFYDKNHSSKGLYVSEKIIQEFDRTARARGRFPLTLTIPCCRDLEYFRKSGVWPYQSLLELLTRDRLEFLNPGDGMMKYLQTRDPCELCKECGGHFNEEGNRVLAGIVYQHLERIGLLDEKRQR